MTMIEQHNGNALLAEGFNQLRAASKFRAIASYSDFFLVLCLGLSLSGNVFLGWKIKSLNIANTHALSESPHVGQSVPTMQATDSFGKVRDLSFNNGRTTVVYIFRPGCKWCASNLGNIVSFYRQSASVTDFVGISTTKQGLEEYLREKPLPFPVYVLSDHENLSTFDVVGTPQTIEISSSGKIQNNWVGAYNISIITAIQDRFHVKLPGLIQEK